MQPEMYQPDPNLIAETYRNHIIELPMRFQKHYDFIDVNPDGIFLLGTSNLIGRIWSGSLWVFDNPSHPPDVEKCLAGMEFDSGIAVGKWFDNGLKVVVGTDSGAIHILSLTSMINVNKHYLSSVAIISEHDDSVSSIDVTSDNKKMLSGSADMNIKIWDVDNFFCERTYDCAHAHMITSVCYQPGEQDVFVSTSLDGNSLIWDTHLDKPASLLMKADSGYTSCCWVNENCVALGATSGSVSLIDLRMRCELDRNFCSKRPIFSTVYNKSSDLLAVCADDPTIRVFDCSLKTLKNIYECERHKDFVRGLTWKTPDLLYSCAWDSTILCHKIPEDDRSRVDGKEEKTFVRSSEEEEEEEENTKC